MLSISGWPVDNRIVNFFGEGKVADGLIHGGESCPMCDASLEWNGGETRNLITHIDWHQKIGFWESA